MTLCIVWYFALFFIAVPLTLWHVYNFRAYELIGLGLGIDAYFLSTLSVPYYTLGFLGLFVGMELLKPRLRNQEQL